MHVKVGLLGLAGTATNLGEEQVDTEWCVLVLEERLQLGDLLAEHVWGVANSSENTEASGVGNGCSELRAGGNVHTSKHNRVVNLEEVGGNRAELFCRWPSVGKLGTTVNSGVKGHDVRGEAMVNAGVGMSELRREALK